MGIWAGAGAAVAERPGSRGGSSRDYMHGAAWWRIG